MARIVVIGSGASGVHFAAAALQRGHDIVMLDVGIDAPQSVLPEARYSELKACLDRPTDYFLGPDLHGVLLPNNSREYYGIPPSKDYVFESPAEGRGFQASGFAPLFSFAQGGLAQAWTGGCYPFNEHELKPFPFGYSEIGRFYDDVAREIGINGAEDDTARFFPVHKHLLPGLELDEHARLLLQRYQARRSALNRLGAYVGRSRAATRSTDEVDRRGCWHCGRCLWGCPTHSLYTPKLTLDACRQHARFTYQNGVFVERLQLDHQQRAQSVIARRLQDGSELQLSADAVVAAAGTLCSARIFLETIRQHRGEIIKLPGLMDNRQVLMPFLTLAMMGRPVPTDHYQYHQLMMAIDMGSPADLVHCQITTLKSATVHPIVQSIPLNLRAASRSFREIRAALGILNINLSDTRRSDNYLTLQPQRSSSLAPLTIRYQPPHDEPQKLRRILARARKCLWKLGAVAPRPMTHIRPMGASVHYAGVLPMSTSERPLTTSVNCRSHDIPNLYFVDGTAFNFLPAKNLTFTLMANARRVAEAEF